MAQAIDPAAGIVATAVAEWRVDDGLIGGGHHSYTSSTAWKHLRHTGYTPRQHQLDTA